MVMQIPILAGRPFAPADEHRDVTIVSRRLALALCGTIDAVGREPQSRTVIGVAGDAPFVRLRREGVAEQYMPLRPHLYGEPSSSCERGTIRARYSRRCIEPLAPPARVRCR
jgi:hypothetical protein